MQMVAVWKSDVYHLLCVHWSQNTVLGIRVFFTLFYKIFLYILIILDLVILESVTPVMMGRLIDVRIVLDGVRVRHV